MSVERTAFQFKELFVVVLNLNALKLYTYTLSRSVYLSLESQSPAGMCTRLIVGAEVGGGE